MALLVACTVWVLYVALEPHARRLWPTSMFGWARLLDGRLKDPLIGRDVLIGGLFGTAHYLSRTLPDLMRPGEFTPFVPSANRVHDMERHARDADQPAGGGSLQRCFVFLVILLLRLVVRTDRRTVVAYLLLWGGLNAAGAAGDRPRCRARVDRARDGRDHHRAGNAIRAVPAAGLDDLHDRTRRS